jgi:alkylation response protein AidB-like acyl-CoA dehydrogenase
MRADFLGDTLVGPTILQWGSDEQKQEFLPKILRGEIRWCQGFSEPDSGSDLASLSCSARLDGDEWVINGQKVWTSRADVADYCFLLARTDPDAPKHQGISYLLVPMNQPGIDASGIRQLDGSEEFAEVFFSDARCPEHNVVGGVNNGWRVANSTLGFERGMSAMTSHNRFEQEFKQIVAAATASGMVEDPVLRQRLMRFYTKVQILRVNGRRTLAATMSGSQDSGVRALGATNKILWTEMHQDAMELALATFGASSLLIDTGPTDGKWPGPFHGVPPAGYPVSRMMAAYLFSLGETIFGGTSQIQRNIIGERVLGLPKEPPKQAEPQSD